MNTNLLSVLRPLRRGVPHYLGAGTGMGMGMGRPSDDNLPTLDWRTDRIGIGIARGHSPLCLQFFY